ncbi:unnamed protein product [Lymnaea stagnalis]|uniref:G-protein coupled receptors family 1 profile domain-containing protein n=1 Tax=Lymnaea stagnalis TaxID=6523 RepID=A0AAV2I777_LYMST
MDDKEIHFDNFAMGDVTTSTVQHFQISPTHASRVIGTSRDVEVSVETLTHDLNSPTGNQTLVGSSLWSANSSFTDGEMSSEQDPNMAFNKETQIPIIVLYTALCVVAVLGNACTVYVVLSRRKMRNVTNYFIASLAFSDLLMAIMCIPFSFVANVLLEHWPFGAALCPIVPYLQVGIVFQNAYTMLAMSLERYLAIMHPFMRRLGKRRCLQVVALCWVLAFMTPIPTAVTSQIEYKNDTDQTQGYCNERWATKKQQFSYSLTIMILQYFVPLAVLVYTYAQIVRVIWLKDMPAPAELLSQNSKEEGSHQKNSNKEPDPRKKIIKMMITVVGIYGICWLPLHAITILGDVNPNIWERTHMIHVWIGCHFMAMSSCAYNPFIYWWMNPKFREGYVDLFRRMRSCFCYVCRCRTGRKHSSASLGGRRFVTKYRNGNNSPLSRQQSNTQMVDFTGVYTEDHRKYDSLALAEQTKEKSKQPDFIPELSKISEVTENGVNYYGMKTICSHNEDLAENFCRT